MTRIKRQYNSEPRLADGNPKNQNTKENPSRIESLECKFRDKEPYLGGEDGIYRCKNNSDKREDACGEFGYVVKVKVCGIDPTFKTEDCGYAQRNGSKKYMCNKPDKLVCEHIKKCKGVEYCKIRI